MTIRKLLPALSPLALLAVACGAQAVHATAAAKQPAAGGTAPRATRSAAAAPKAAAPAASAASAATAAAPAAPAAPSRCGTGQLSIRLGRDSGAAGSVYAPLVFTNTGETSCTLTGYPGVSYVAPQSGKQVGAAAERNPQHPVHTVTLSPGGRAAAVLQRVNYLNYPAGSCKATHVSGLRVYPPGSRTAAYVAFSHVTSACSSQAAQLTVEAVAAR